MGSIKNLFRLSILALLFFVGIWFLNQVSDPAPESLTRQQIIRSFAPAAVGNSDASSEIIEHGVSFPTTVNLADVPAGVYDPNNQFDRWQRGEMDLQERTSPLHEAEIALLQAEALKLPPNANIQIAPTEPGTLAPTNDINFDSIDYTECCGGGGNVPPDPELAVGPDHIIAVVNVAFEIYDKSGNSLDGPTTFASFMASDPNCTDLFDPNVLYDEREDRFILGIDAAGIYYCVAVSQTEDPTGSWNIYSFVTGNGLELFFDYPHAGVGNEAIYMGANMFDLTIPDFVDSRVWAFDKAAMYSGAPAPSVMVNLGEDEFTPQPLNLHGWNQGTWPTGDPHYFITNTNFNGADHTIFSWIDPFGANIFDAVNTIDLNAATGVNAGLSVAFPQDGGDLLDGNDWRPQDFEYRNGSAWTTMTIGCNPGGGTVNCVRWAQIDLATTTVLDAGVYSSDGEYRQFPDLAVNHCDDMAVGYTKSSDNIFPSIFVTGREVGDPAGTLQAEVQLIAGEITYTSFETIDPVNYPARRWGDYTGMTIDPDGLTFWYLGEYSKDTGTADGRWGTYIGSYSFGSCMSMPEPDVYEVYWPLVLNNFPPTYSISGRVVDIDNTPIADVTVTSDSGVSTTTIGDGTYVLEGLLAGTYILTPSKSGYTFALSPRIVTIPPDAAGQDFTAVPIPPPPPPPPPPTPCAELVGNGGFEWDGSWEIPVNEYPAAYTMAVVQEGNRSMRVGITNPVDNKFSYSSAQQWVTIPADVTSATFGFWLYPVSGEGPLYLPTDYQAPNVINEPLSNDAQYVLIFDKFGQQDTLLFQRNNDQLWAYYQFDLLQYAGQSILIYFGAYNDGWDGATGMYVDDVSLEVCQ